MQWLIDNKYISVREHPDDPDLKIYNYMPRAVYERYWCEETRMARGLIMYKDTIVSRPLPKFFNWNEEGADKIELSEQVRAYDKLDGSLGVEYIAPDGLPAIATRGSFTSPQAQWATDYLRSRPSINITLDYTKGTQLTTLREIIYPENRIVLDYGRYEGIPVLGQMEVDTGKWRPDKRLMIGTGVYQDMLNTPPRHNKEGIVIETADGRRVKIKQQDYIDLHRVVTNITPKNSWELWKTKGEHYLEDIPNEFHAEVAAHVNKQLKVIGLWQINALEQYMMIPADLDRKEYAQYAKATDWPAYMFAMYDNNIEKAYNIIEQEALKYVSNDPTGLSSVR